MQVSCEKLETKLSNMNVFRTPGLHAFYMRELRDKPASSLMDAPVLHVSGLKTEHEHWRIIANAFPYDEIAEIHHMLIPKEVVGEFADISASAQKEYHEIMSEIDALDYYTFTLLNFSKGRSVTSHWHIHLIRAKERE